MKKFKLFLLSFFTIILFTTNVYAECDKDNIEDLREWATKAEVLFTETTNAYSDQFAYFLSVTPARDDIIVKVEDQYGAMDEAQEYKEVNLYAVGCNTNLEEMTYTVSVYSKCNNELLKTMKYIVPRYNRMIQNDVCEKYPNHELCKAFTNATKDMSEADFLKTMEEYDKAHTETTIWEKIVSIVREYGIFILVPFLIITLVYIIKIQEFKKEERKK